MACVIVQGDDANLVVQLYKDSETFVIAPGATVKASLVKDDVASTPVTCSSSASGAAWTTSLVVVPFVAAVSALFGVGVHEMRVQVDDTTVRTWIISDIVVEKGYIS